VRRLFLGSVLSILAGVTACSADSAPEDTSSADVEPIVDSHTLVVEATAGKDVDIGNDSLRFTRTGHEDLFTRHPGDILVSKAGFARRITGVRPDGDHILVSTAAASLEDLFVQGDLKQTLGPGAADTPATVVHTQGLTLPVLRFVLNGVRLDSSPFGSFEISDGEFSFQPHLDVGVKIKNRALDHFILRAEGDAHASVHTRFNLKRPPYTATGLMLARGGWPVASAEPVTTIVFVGGVPVLLTVKLELLVSYALELTGDAIGDETFSVDTSVAAGAEYRDHAWHNLGGVTFKAGPVGHATVPMHSLAGDITLTGRVTLLVYELAGPFVALQAYGGIGHEGDGAGGQWFGQVGMRGLFGGRVEVLGRAIGGYEAQIFDQKAKFAL
jgi:hypothetical protein